MEYFFYCRDKQGSMPKRLELAEEHWTFMDGYADRMIARGPTFTLDDDDNVTGSLHIVDLPDAETAHAFAFEEPNHRAGVYGEVLIRRWTNVLGRTMWEYAHAQPDHHRFLIIAQGRTDTRADEAQARYLDTSYRERLIAYGPLLSDDGTTWQGTALLVELPDRATAETLIANDPYARDGRYETVEIHDWMFGGRR
ncbi:YciI family protein [Streptomyces sp. NPDC090106]|uniref:YciI family protein n=1 Tax=Streptomyces sp. NPDC090106 TaxID=3365946 RepID=UPI003802737A